MYVCVYMYISLSLYIYIYTYIYMYNRYSTCPPALNRYLTCQVVFAVFFWTKSGIGKGIGNMTGHKKHGKVTDVEVVTLSRCALMRVVKPLAVAHADICLAQGQVQGIDWGLAMRWSQTVSGLWILATRACLVAPSVWVGCLQRAMLVLNSMLNAAMLRYRPTFMFRTRSTSSCADGNTCAHAEYEGICT